MSELKHFVKIRTSVEQVKIDGSKIEVASVYPTYLLTGQDIMKKGGDFYAIYDERTGLWSRNESTIQEVIDRDIQNYISKHCTQDSFGHWIMPDGHMVYPKFIDDSKSGQLFEFNRWFNNITNKNHNYIQLDTELTFKSTEVTPTMYRSMRLNYDVMEGPTPCYDKLMTTLYDEENRQKIEWAIGAVLSGDSKKLDKMIVIYGRPGKGKGTVLKIIEKLFDGYWATFVADDLASGQNQFATAAFKDNPLVAIQEDGTLKRIESPIINQIVSHETTMINEKSKRQYPIIPNAMLFVATNDFVDLRDTKIGMTRRLIDVYPSLKTLEGDEYFRVKEGLQFEYGAIAYHCLEVYKSLGKLYYAKYRPTEMIRKTNLLLNFFDAHLEEFMQQEIFTCGTLYLQFKEYCKDQGYTYTPTRLPFDENVKEYFEEYYPRRRIDDKQYRGLLVGLKVNKILGIQEEEKPTAPTTWIDLQEQDSPLDELYSDMPAQYDEDGRPAVKWANCKTTLKDIDPHKYHWFKLPVQVIKMDFDKRGPNGEKSLEENIKAATKYPRTYAEVSKSGCGLHLYYIYTGDVNELSRLAEDNVEIKLSVGNNAHRRLLTKCNNLPVATISAGLPLKEEKKVVNEKVVTTEAGLRATIRKCLAKEVHPDTRSNVDWIYEILERAHEAGLKYDVSDLYDDVYKFACKSTHQSDYCKNKVLEMKFASETDLPNDVEIGYELESEEGPIIIFDIEVYPNLLLVCWSYEDDDAPVIRMYNPSPEELATLFGIHEIKKPRFIGFNNRAYDAHIVYGRILGDSIEECYYRSRAIINGDGYVSESAHIREAYRLCYADIYDFSTKKQSLKKWEYELELNHDEMELPWDQPVPEELWTRVGDYCENDVKATKALFKHLQGDYVVRQALADLSGLDVIDTNRQHITRILIGNKKTADHVYTNLATGYAEDINGMPYPLNPNIINSFPGYEYVLGQDGKYHNMYLGTDVGRGGYVYAVPGMYTNVSCQDVTNMHGASILAMNVFGEDTINYENVRRARNAVKHRDREELAKYFDGKLVKYLDDDIMADALQGALKLFLNSTYGIKAATFDNPLRDPRDKNNIVALRGACFMRGLQQEVESRGYKVVHIKTDSIKIANPDDYILDYVKTFGELYGYEFEHECTYERFCLVNDAVYIAKYDSQGIRNKGGKHANEWTATGAQFAEPYVFKTLFSHEPIIFKDKCQVKSCSTAFYIDYNENLPEGEHDYHFVGKVGQFCPIKSGCGGGVLYRENSGWDEDERLRTAKERFAAATGTKGYRWLESQYVKAMGKEDDVDDSYYRKLVDAAVTDISKYGDFEWFVGNNDIESHEFTVD